MQEDVAWKVEYSLGRFMRGSQSALEIVGSDSPASLAGLLSLPKAALNEKPHLVVVGDAQVAARLVISLQFFAPEPRAFILPGFDVGIYSNLYPNRRVNAARLGWMWRTHNTKAGEIFIAPVEALVQR